MGGFTVNGCGASDHYKKIKSLGFYECANCKKVTEYFLVEAKFKIDVFFIPTVTLKSRYAVKCGKCERSGEYCSDEWASRLMNEGDQHSMIFESEYLQNTACEKPAPAGTETTSAKKFCGKCGSPILEDSCFCVHCGTKV